MGTIDEKSKWTLSLWMNSIISSLGVVIGWKNVVWGSPKGLLDWLGDNGTTKFELLRGGLALTEVAVGDPCITGGGTEATTKKPR